MRVAADEIALGHVLDHAGRDVAGEGGVVGLAIADDAAVGGQLDEDEIFAADAGRRVADDPGLDVGDFHASLCHVILQHHFGALPSGHDRGGVGVAGDVVGKDRGVDDAQARQPWTRRRGSTTDCAGSGPMRQVETG